MTSPSDGRGQIREERWADGLYGTVGAATHDPRGHLRSMLSDALRMADEEQAALRARLMSCEANLEACRRTLTAATARAEKVERDAERTAEAFEHWIDEARTRTKEAEVERDRLRDGIQALADGYELAKPREDVVMSLFLSRLRALASTPDTEETP